MFQWEKYILYAVLQYENEVVWEEVVVLWIRVS